MHILELNLYINRSPTGGEQSELPSNATNECSILNDQEDSLRYTVPVKKVLLDAEADVSKESAVPTSQPENEKIITTVSPDEHVANQVKSSIYIVLPIR